MPPNNATPYEFMGTIYFQTTTLCDLTLLIWPKIYKFIYFFLVFQQIGVWVFKVSFFSILIFFCVCCNVSLFIYDFIYLGLFFLLVCLAELLSILLIFSKNQLSILLIPCFFHFYLIDISSDFDDLFQPTVWECGLVLFFQVFRCIIKSLI